MHSAVTAPRRRLRGRRLPRRLAQLYAGLVLSGMSMALLVQSGLGVIPRDVLHQGHIHHQGPAMSGPVTYPAGLPVAEEPVRFLSRLLAVSYGASEG